MNVPSIQQDYTPIACSLHDVYEIAIMRGRRLDLCWEGEDGSTQAEVVTPKDLLVRDGAEWLAAVTRAGKSVMLRLDRIRTVAEV